ncbi:MAG: UDP-glucose/GDP-mannose dehydrogenase family protein [Weeksellaceae bacterium]|nr:UDP-glucose/GDP-mannose dehydrogenase family protein [Weeksellaceae bacterium]
MKILVIGTGYVGLVTGACLADVGMKVVCIDSNKQKVENLQQDIIPIYEPGLQTIVRKNRLAGRLVFETSMKEHIDGADAIFIAVGTPPDAQGNADMQYVDSVAEEIGTYIKSYTVVVTKSTVPVGTSERISANIRKKIEQRSENIEFDVASNPEFLKEGAAIEDFLSPDRIIIGTQSPRAKSILENIYKPFQLNGYRIIYMDIASAELTKYAANAMLATRISFMNSLAQLCEKTGADIQQIRQGIGADPRIGKKFLYAGVGYGGSCFPKDVRALIKTAQEHLLDFPLLEAVNQVNEEQTTFFSNKILQYFAEHNIPKKVGILGLSFKPNTDDMREAPSLKIIEQLLANDFTIKVFDPVAMDNAKEILGDSVHWSHDLYSCLHNTSAGILVTEWNEFRFPDWERAASLMQHSIIFDGRNIYESNYLQQYGIEHIGIGLNT